jgi:acyl-CoA reductase-like NAD-dependent aldehyde dehydrogenase
MDSGNTISAMRIDVANAIRTIGYYTGIASELKGDTLPSDTSGMYFTLREPHGVAASITAYNHPFYFAIDRTIGSLLAGNTMVLKPPEQDSITSLMLAEVVADVFPKGVWNIVTGSGPGVGAPLVRHPTVRRITFTGSASTGKLIFRSAAETGLKSVTLELGGKNPIIVFPDADLGAAAAAAVAGMNFTLTAGQSCMSTSRAFVHADVHDAFLSKVAEQMSSIRVGLPLDESSQMGPVVSEAQYNKVMGYIDLAGSEGADRIVGGERPSDPRLTGYYVMPTLFDNVTMGMRVANEEIFGPVLAVLPWNDEDRLLSEVNAVDYGLTAAIWTRDIQKALRFAYEVVSGLVWINGRGETPGIPHGGFKDSGLGRLGCIEDLVTNTQQKAVAITIR